jgi:hypothetical protein
MQARSPSLRNILTSDAERLAFEGQPFLAGLFNEAARVGRDEAATPTKPATLFLTIQSNGDAVAAPGFEPSELLQAPDAGLSIQLSFGDVGDGRWPEDPRSGLGDRSEKEVAGQLAQSLLPRFGVTSGNVEVDRAPNAPFAAAYSYGKFWVNPALVSMYAAYLAGSANGGSPHAAEAQ